MPKLPARDIQDDIEKPQVNPKIYILLKACRNQGTHGPGQQCGDGLQEWGRGVAWIEEGSGEKLGRL